MDIKLLLHIAYRGLIEEISEIDERLTTRMALPRQRVYRHIASRHDTWANRTEWVDKERSVDKERLQRLVTLLEELETHYRKYHDADDDAWAEAAAAFVMQGRKK